MDGDQAAILWWRQLRLELGSSAHRRTPGPAGLAAMERVKALRELFFRILRLNDVRLLIEIGAHKAEASRRFVRMKEGARAVAYEASPDVYKRVVDAGIPPGVELINAAVGPENTTAPFFVPEDEKMQHWSSLRKRLIHPVPVREVQVSMVTLDQAGRTAAGEGPAADTALWIDVEGAALDVLNSGRDFLKERVLVVFLEMSDAETYENSNTSLDILQLLLQCGFVPVARDNQYRDAYNLLAVRSSVYQSMLEIMERWLSTQRDATRAMAAAEFAEAPSAAPANT
jgi:FkbM family methyltransferase